MKYKLLATDYDGTIAHRGEVDASTVDALRRGKSAGLKIVLVTGRLLSDVPVVFPQWTLFDRVVAENGAVLCDPATEKNTLLSPPAPPALLERLRKQKIPLQVGHSIVASIKPYDRVIAEAITDLKLEWHLIFNNEAVMALPVGVSKASGLLAALGDLQIPVEQSAAVGDAENDLEFLGAAGFAVAVANALPSVKAKAQWTTPGERGAGVAQLIDRLISM